MTDLGRRGCLMGLAECGGRTVGHLRSGVVPRVLKGVCQPLVDLRRRPDQIVLEGKCEPGTYQVKALSDLAQSRTHVTFEAEGARLQVETPGMHGLRMGSIQ